MQGGTPNTIHTVNAGFHDPLTIIDVYFSHNCI
jgi:hypothetical protein